MIVFHSDTINGIGGSGWMLEDANGTYFEYQVSSAIGNPIRTPSQPYRYLLNFDLDVLPPVAKAYTNYDPTPEPATASLLALGSAMLLLRRRRAG
ncbi:MAG: PEP-CTERM sorting domain-containing protein [Kiritimatiellaeota bacterium]|nr:PEP-CTERM sorting domain-containing protein [Kiritimatiellota bacterium]